MHSSVIPLASVAEHLRQPYSGILWGQSTGDKLVAYAKVMEACSAWLPTSELEPVPVTVRDAVLGALRGAGSELGAIRKLPSGEVLYSRASLASCGAGELANLLRQEQGPGGVGQGELRQLLADLGQQAEAEDAMVEGDDEAETQVKKSLRVRALGLGLSLRVRAPDHPQGFQVTAPPCRCPVPNLPLSSHNGDVLQVRLVRALAGAPELSQTLRYKKKMTMWTLPSPSPAAAGGPAAAAAAGAGPAQEGEVGYCMMTFVIRNGLKALQLGQSTYMNYVGSLAKSWALPHQMEAQVCVHGMGSACVLLALLVLSGHAQP